MIFFMEFSVEMVIVLNIEVYNTVRPNDDIFVGFSGKVAIILDIEVYKTVRL